MAARQVFLNELVELAVKNAGATQNGVSGSLNHSPDNPQDLANAPKSCTTMGKRIVEALQTMGKGVKQIWFMGQGVRYDFYRVQFSNFVKLENLHEQICSELGIANDDLRCERIEGAANTWHINILRDEVTWQKPSKTEFQDALAQYQSSGKSFRLPVCIGIDERGEPVFQDFATAPHAIIGGATGMGKSVIMRGMLSSLFELVSPKKLEIAIVYCKEYKDFAAFQHYPNLWEQRIISEPQEALDALQFFVDEMDRRYQASEENLKNGINQSERNKTFVLVIDELADLILINREVEPKLVRLAMKARAANIHLLLATQRPDAETISSQLSNNLNVKIALRVDDHHASQIILKEKGAEKLAGKGDHFVKWNGGEKQFLHGYNV
ncbi:FtsK/SpoIIIE domain-containing protein [Neisseriaceae bacterium B1]